VSGDKHGGMVDVLLSALETDDKPTIRFYKTATFPAFPMFVCENCKCDICSQTLWLTYFAPIETTIFRHILGNGVCGREAPNNLLVDVGANVGYFSAYASALGCRVASFEPNEHPRRYLEASAALHDPHHLSWKVYPVAIGKEVCTQNFYRKHSSPSCHSLATLQFFMQLYDELLAELPNLVAQASSSNPRLTRSMPGADEMD
jgi:FkbM family methyltransferase